MSEKFELLVVGGGPAGLSAARAYRRAGGTGPVAIVADEQRMPYRRPPLTKELLRGEITEDELPIEGEPWLGEQSVALVSGRVVYLDPERATAGLSDGRQLAYERCVLATGAEPRRLPVPGVDDPAVRVLRTLDHVRELNHRLRALEAVIVIGSGFIGCEIASSLCARGVAVTLLTDEAAPNAARLGAEAAAHLEDWLVEDGVELVLGSPVEAIVRRDGELEVIAGDHAVRAPLVVMAVGVVPRSELAGAAGLAVRQGAIVTDETMRTDAAGILAAGDVSCAVNAAAGRALRVEHWGDALAQGEVAGRCAAGEPARWESVPGFWSTIGGRTVKYVAWGDGFDDIWIEEHGDGSFTAWYGRQGKIVGVLTHRADHDYENGRSLIAEGSPWR